MPLTRRGLLTALTASLLPRAGLTIDSATPAKTVWGIAELFEWVLQRRQSTGHDTADCLQAHLDHGIRHVMWHLGRSTLDYHSELPTSTRYTGDTRPESKLIADSLAKECSLRAALAFAEPNKMVIYGRLAMNRHYGPGYGGGLRSKFCADHPEWLERDRRGNLDQTRLSFAVPEYRAERIAILLEAARIGAHGLCLDFCRQPPLVRYHPLVLEPWLAQGKPDPRKMQPGTPEFLEWSRHRCHFITLFLRDLRAQLGAFEKTSGRKVPILARITEGTLDLNLMEGIDLKTWAAESLIDEIALDPFLLWDYPYPHTAAPYVRICHAKGIKLYGGANTTAARGTRANARAFLERIDRNYREGADGIALYQTDTPIWHPKLKPILGPLFPHLSTQEALTKQLAIARQAQPDLDEKSKWFSLDNHSKLPQFGHPPSSLEAL
ncbi:MAG TPA: hypothetical protein VD994_07475 [Prosthecobacter sp.]|nr:hypothetical protein [Prosthecobacter sp.]